MSLSGTDHGNSVIHIDTSKKTEAGVVYADRRDEISRRCFEAIYGNADIDEFLKTQFLLQTRQLEMNNYDLKSTQLIKIGNGYGFHNKATPSEYCKEHVHETENLNDDLVSQTHPRSAKAQANARRQDEANCHYLWFQTEYNIKGSQGKRLGPAMLPGIKALVMKLEEDKRQLEADKRQLEADKKQLEADKKHERESNKREIHVLTHALNDKTEEVQRKRFKKPEARAVIAMLSALLE